MKCIVHASRLQKVQRISIWTGTNGKINSTNLFSVQSNERLEVQFTYCRPRTCILSKHRINTLISPQPPPPLIVFTTPRTWSILFSINSATFAIVEKTFGKHPSPSEHPIPEMWVMRSGRIDRPTHAEYLLKLPGPLRTANARESFQKRLNN